MGCQRSGGGYYYIVGQRQAIAPSMYAVLVTIVAACSTGALGALCVAAFYHVRHTPRISYPLPQPYDIFYCGF